MCWTDRYVNTVYSNLSRLMRQDPIPLIRELIEKHYGRRSAEVYQSISVVAISPALDEVLQVEPGSSALRIVRRYVDRVGETIETIETIETTISVHPPGRYTFSMVLKRASVA